LLEFSGNGTDCDIAGEILESCQTLSMYDNGQYLFWARSAGKRILITSDRYLENARIDVFTVDGRKIFSDQLSLAIGESLIEYPSIPEGIYLLRIQSEGIHYNNKIFLQ
jgi:hypothetical protein